jgi:hypothetical protein
LADTLLLTGRAEAGLEEVRKAIHLIPREERRASLTSVIEPLQDFLAAEVLDPQTAEGVRRAIDDYVRAIAAADEGQPDKGSQVEEG